MNKFITKKGTILFWEITFQVGGYNYINGIIEPRGYSVKIIRDPLRFKTISQSSNVNAVRCFLREVEERSEKQKAISKAMVTDGLLQDIADKYNV